MPRSSTSASPNFPAVKGNPADYVLVAHCGYLGVVPQAFATEWKLRKKVLAIVEENSAVIDAPAADRPHYADENSLRFQRPDRRRGELLEDYAQFSGSDCRNGGVLHLQNGHRLMSHLASHHALLMTGHQHADIDTIAPIFSLTLKNI